MQEILLIWSSVNRTEQHENLVPVFFFKFIFVNGKEIKQPSQQLNVYFWVAQNLTGLDINEWWQDFNFYVKYSFKHSKFGFNRFQIVYFLCLLMFQGCRAELMYLSSKSSGSTWGNGLIFMVCDCIDWWNDYAASTQVKVAQEMFTLAECSFH